MTDMDNLPQPFDPDAAVFPVSIAASLATKDSIVHVPGFKVKAVDTTAAGDTFNAGLATGMAMGMEIAEAVKLAHGAAALSVTAFGAQDGMPSMERVKEFMKEQA